MQQASDGGREVFQRLWCDGLHTIERCFAFVLERDSYFPSEQILRDPSALQCSHLVFLYGLQRLYDAECASLEEASSAAFETLSSREDGGEMGELR